MTQNAPPQWAEGKTPSEIFQIKQRWDEYCLKLVKYYDAGPRPSYSRAMVECSQCRGGMRGFPDCAVDTTDALCPGCCWDVQAWVSLGKKLDKDAPSDATPEEEAALWRLVKAGVIPAPKVQPWQSAASARSRDDG